MVDYVFLRQNVIGPKNLIDGEIVKSQIMTNFILRWQIMDFGNPGLESCLKVVFFEKSHLLGKTSQITAFLDKHTKPLNFKLFGQKTSILGSSREFTNLKQQQHPGSASTKIRFC